MADLEWPSIEEKFEAIGYLAVPGVIDSIEATVPIGKSDQFRKEYEGRFTDEYPYEADKYGKQFRIYLNDTEGCPDFLRKHLDGRYGNRINNTQFIDELVKEYGFKFTKAPQDSKLISECVYVKEPGTLAIDGFRKGFDGYREFVEHIEEKVKTEDNLSIPNVLEYEEKSLSRKIEKKGVGTGDNKASTGYTPNQMLKLGWVDNC